MPIDMNAPGLAFPKGKPRVLDRIDQKAALAAQERACRKAVKARDKRLLAEKHLRMSIEDWRQKKRQEWRAVANAMALFTYGCAYTPVGNDFYEMQKAADRIKEAMEDEWICW